MVVGMWSTTMCHTSMNQCDQCNYGCSLQKSDSSLVERATARSTTGCCDTEYVPRIISVMPLKQAPTYVRHHSRTPNFSESTRSSTKNNLRTRHQIRLSRYVYLTGAGLAVTTRECPAPIEGDHPDIAPRIQVLAHFESSTIRPPIECIKKCNTLSAAPKQVLVQSSSNN